MHFPEGTKGLLERQKMVVRLQTWVQVASTLHHWAISLAQLLRLLLMTIREGIFPKHQFLCGTYFQMLQEPSIMTLVLIIIIWLKKPKYQPFPFFPIDSQQATNQSPNHNSVIINPRSSVLLGLQSLCMIPHVLPCTNWQMLTSLLSAHKVLFFSAWSVRCFKLKSTQVASYLKTKSKCL